MVFEMCPELLLHEDFFVPVTHPFQLENMFLYVTTFEYKIQDLKNENKKLFHMLFVVFLCQFIHVALKIIHL